MNGNKTVAIRIKNRSFGVPLTDNEMRRIHEYLMDTGLKKGHFVRKAILNELERQESHGERE